jgi:acylphosphatase
MRRVHVIVSGRVQGVFFRGATHAQMRSLGLSGWVRNLPDGRVEAVVEGDDARVERALAFLRRGPPHAKVESVEVRDEPCTGLRSEFELRRES